MSACYDSISLLPIITAYFVRPLGYLYVLWQLNLANQAISSSLASLNASQI